MKSGKWKRKCVWPAVILLAGLLSGCGKPADQSVAVVRENGALRVAIPDTESVLLYQDEESGTYAGTEAEIAEFIAQALGVPVQYLPMKKSEITTKLSLGEADIAIGSLTQEISQGLLSSVSYADGYLYIVTPKGVYAGDLGIFDNKALGVTTEISENSKVMLYAIDKVTLQGYNNYDSVLSDLRAQKIAGYVCYQMEAEKLLKTGDFQIQNAFMIEKEPYVILAPSASGNLINGIDTLIQQYLTAPKEEE